MDIYGYVQIQIISFLDALESVQDARVLDKRQNHDKILIST